jgi:colanic acid/amylovoran biosynthesis glycosyltransferase
VIRIVHSVPVWLRQTQTWIYTQLRYLPRERIENHVVCESVINLEQFPVEHLHDFRTESKVRRLLDRGLRRIGLRHHLGYLARTARRLRAPIIHSHFADIAWTNMRAARSARAKHVATAYGYDISSMPRQADWGKRLEDLFRSLDLLLCEGPYMAKRAVGLGCPPGIVRVHHLGVPLNDLPFEPRVLKPGERLRVLIAATFTEKKGIPFALEALARLRDRLDFEITVIGDAQGHPENQVEKQRILDVLSRTGLRNRVKLLGYQSHSKMIMEGYRHHLFLSPSVTAADGTTEGGAPVSLIEMAATGMPVISSRHCDIPNVIRDRETGWLADERDVPGLAACIEEMVLHPERWRPFLEAGRRHIETEFDARRQGARLVTLYESLLGKETAPDGL